MCGPPANRPSLPGPRPSIVETRSGEVGRFLRGSSGGRPIDEVCGQGAGARKRRRPTDRGKADVSGGSTPAHRVMAASTRSAAPALRSCTAAQSGRGRGITKAWLRTSTAIGTRRVGMFHAAQGAPATRTRPGLDAVIDEVRWFQQLQAAAPAFAQPEAPARGPGAAARNLWRRLAPLLTARGWSSWRCLALPACCLLRRKAGCPGSAAPPTGRLKRSMMTPNGAWTRASTMAQRRHSGRITCSSRLIRTRRSLASTAFKTLKELAQGYAAAGACIADRDWECARGELEAILLNSSEILQCTGAS